jgi:hypothetical protein
MEYPLDKLLFCYGFVNILELVLIGLYRINEFDEFGTHRGLLLATKAKWLIHHELNHSRIHSHTILKPFAPTR